MGTLRLQQRMPEWRRVWASSTLHYITRKARMARYLERCALKGALL